MKPTSLRTPAPSHAVGAPARGGGVVRSPRNGAGTVSLWAPRRHGGRPSLSYWDADGIMASAGRLRMLMVALLMQLWLVFMHSALSVYEGSADPSGDDARGNALVVWHQRSGVPVRRYHSMFMDVHVMIFIGFGFLMTFLRRYGYSSVGLNMLVSALSIQWAALATGFFHMENGKIPIAIDSILSADLATAAVLISLGAVLGKTSPLQLLVMAVGEIAVFATNEWLGLHIFKAVDAGGSIFVHVFGAYFGLAVSFVLCRGGTEKHHSSNEGASYRSDLFAMIGTIFLWIFWPSFNAALVTGDQQHRAIINTYFSLAACCVTAFAVSAAVTKGFKFDMVHIQNATLAGGVAVGTAADMMVQPYGALLIGMAAGTLSVFGYHFLQPFLLSKINLHDTCGVHNLHGMPGVMAGLVGAIMAGIASETDYSYSLYLQFPARAPPANSSEYTEIFQALNSVQPGDNRSAQAQAGYQLLALGCTMVIAIVAGLVMGFILRLPALSQVPPELLYDDKFTWEVPEVGDEEGCSASTGERPAASIYRPDGKRTDQVLEIDS